VVPNPEAAVGRPTGDAIELVTAVGTCRMIASVLYSL
jgi:hypothetical protein